MTKSAPAREIRLVWLPRKFPEQGALRMPGRTCRGAPWRTGHARPPVIVTAPIGCAPEPGATQRADTKAQFKAAKKPSSSDQRVNAESRRLACPIAGCPGVPSPQGQRVKPGIVRCQAAGFESLWAATRPAARFLAHNNDQHLTGACFARFIPPGPAAGGSSAAQPDAYSRQPGHKAKRHCPIRAVKTHDNECAISAPRVGDMADVLDA
jgi:hypothetical protein